LAIVTNVRAFSEILILYRGLVGKMTSSAALVDSNSLKLEDGQAMFIKTSKGTKLV